MTPSQPQKPARLKFPQFYGFFVGIGVVEGEIETRLWRLTYAKYAAGGLAARSPKFPKPYDFLTWEGLNKTWEQYRIALRFFW